MKKSGIAMGILSMAFLASCTKDVKETGELTLDQNLEIEQLGSVAAASGQGQKHVPNEILVKFKKGTSATGRANALARISGRVQEHILTKAMERLGDNDGVYLVHTPLQALEAIAKAKGLEVEFAEPNWIYTHNVTSNDTYYSQLWGMKDGNGCNAAAAWNNGKTGNSSVYIGIIDEGYMYSHEDLAANAGKNPGEIAGNGVDEDGNGYVDDVYGWDFAGGDNSVFDGTGDDHGTHVAGTIGGVGGNRVGVAGVVWSVKLLSAKFLGSRGGTTANAIKAVDYFTDLKTDQNLNIVATNNSWGGGGFSQGLYDAIERANAAGILFIAAAGNDSYNLETMNSYPAEYTNANIISVASITSGGALSSFSNYGKTGVDLGAPGSSIASTVPKSSKGKVVSGYASYSGTSMATPHVTGAVALYVSSKGLSPKTSSDAASIKAGILGSVTPTGSLSDKTFTGGRLNVSGF